MTQNELAKKAGVHKGYICQILTGAVVPSESLSEVLFEITGIKPSIWMRGTTMTLRNKWKAVQAAEKEERRFMEEYKRRKNAGLLK